MRKWFRILTVFYFTSESWSVFSSCSCSQRRIHIKFSWSWSLLIHFSTRCTIGGRLAWVRTSVSFPEKSYAFVYVFSSASLFRPYLQNPKDCSKAKKLVCNINKGCGYGCQLHHVVYCFMIAYGTQRTLILESQNWRYATGGWETVFRPVSETCTDRSGATTGHWSGKMS